MPEYVFSNSGSTYGTVTGTLRRYRPGTVIEAPEGEFAQLPQGVYAVRVPDSPEPLQYDTRPVMAGGPSPKSSRPRKPKK